MPDKINNPLLEQLVRRIEGDQQALNQAAALLHAMTDRKAWRRMSWQLPSSMEELQEMLDAKNMTIRQVTLSDGWWKRSTGTMIGFLEADDIPVILRPRFTSYSFVHPKSGRQYKRDSSKSDAMLKREAFAACRPFPERASSPSGILRHALHDLCMADAVY